MEKLQMKHPDPAKKTITMDKQKYDMLKKALVEVLQPRKALNFKQLLSGVKDVLGKQATKFEGNLQWHLACVQTDMEARQELIRDNSVSPQTYRLVNKKAR